MAGEARRPGWQSSPGRGGWKGAHTWSLGRPKQGLDLVFQNKELLGFFIWAVLMNREMRTEKEKGAGWEARTLSTCATARPYMNLPC